VTDERTFAEGYVDGWRGVAGDAVVPPAPAALIRPGETAYQAGFQYGRSDALMQFPPSPIDKNP
jgi:hypothetical protein